MQEKWTLAPKRKREFLITILFLLFLPFLVCKSTMASDKLTIFFAPETLGNYERERPKTFTEKWQNPLDLIKQCSLLVLKSES